MVGFGATFNTFRCLVPTSHGPALQLGWGRGKGKMPLAAPTGPDPAQLGGQWGSWVRRVSAGGDAARQGRRPSRHIPPCPARAAQEVGGSVPVLVLCAVTQIPGAPPPRPATEGAWADGMNERCFWRCSQQALTSVP